MGSHRQPTVLVIDDDPEVRNYIKTLLKSHYALQFADCAAAGQQRFEERKFDVVLLDIMLPDGNGMDLLRLFIDKDAAVKVIMITGVAEIKTAVQAMQDGAYDYLEKPFSVGVVRAAIVRALDHRVLLYRVAYLEGELGQCRPSKGMVGEDLRMETVYDLVNKYGAGTGTVLIQGESGTGKELVARAIHEKSERQSHPMIVVNCAAIPANLLESDLFGHARGAFTGAIKEKIGKLELADHGTVFLDDVDCLEPAMQAKLLRVIQEKEFERVGTSRVITADIRFIAATNKDLQALIREERFREDLYYRLSVLPMLLPPLRERQGDIPLLLDHFLRRHAEKTRMPPKQFAPEALDALTAYPWPGNVRELENIVEQLCTVVSGLTIEHRDLPPHIFGDSGQTSTNLKEAVRAFEKRHIEAVLITTRGNRTQAAKRLGIHRNTLLGKINDLGISE